MIKVTLNNKLIKDINKKIYKKEYVKALKYINDNYNIIDLKKIQCINIIEELDTILHSDKIKNKRICRLNDYIVNCDYIDCISCDLEVACDLKLIKIIKKEK